MAWCSASCKRVSKWMSAEREDSRDRKSTRLNSSHGYISYAVFCLKKNKVASSNAPFSETTSRFFVANCLHVLTAVHRPGDIRHYAGSRDVLRARPASARRSRERDR